MPFLGQDPRGPGFNWYKTSPDSSPTSGGGGWTIYESNRVVLESAPKREVKKALGAYLQQVLDKKHRSLYTTLTAAPDSMSSVKENQKWIQIGTRGSKEIHGYTTIGELIRRLDFESSVTSEEEDEEEESRFRYILRVVELLVHYRLSSLSGSALQHLFDLIEQCLHRVMRTCKEIRRTRELLEDLMTQLQRQSREKIFSSKVQWLRAVARIRSWKKTISSIHVPRRVGFGLTLTDLPREVQHRVALQLRDVDDVISLARVTSTLGEVCGDNSTWRHLAFANFTSAQVSKVIVELIEEKKSNNDVCDDVEMKCDVNNNNNDRQIQWKDVYNSLKSQYERIELDYPHGLLLCKFCSILFWEECGHPCIRPTPDPTEILPISPRNLLTLFS